MKLKHPINEKTLQIKELATKAHENQYRNDSVTPYITHPLKVAEIAVNLYNTNSKYREEKDILYGVNLTDDMFKEYITQVSYLHDIVEDTTITLNDLRVFKINEMVLNPVSRITKKTDKNAESYLDYLFRVKENLISKIVKIADITHNLEDLKPGNMRDKYILALHFLKS